MNNYLQTRSSLYGGQYPSSGPTSTSHSIATPINSAAAAAAISYASGYSFLLAKTESQQRIRIALDTETKETTRLTLSSIEHSAVLQELWLNGGIITVDIACILAAAIRGCKCLQILRLRNVSVAGVSADMILEEVKGSNSLQELYLESNGFDQYSSMSALSHLSQILQRTNQLRVLHIIDNMIGTIGGILIAEALESSNHTLEELSFQQTGFDGPIVDRYMYSHNPHLLQRNLYAPETKTNSLGTAFAKMLSKNTTLKMLHFIGNPDLPPFELAQIALQGFANNRTVEMCVIQGSLIDCDAMSAFSQMLTVNTGLKKLCFWGNGIVTDPNPKENETIDDGCCIKLLAQGLVHNSTLTDLRIRGNNIGDYGVEILCDILLKLSTCSLKLLDLSNSNVTNIGVGYLIQVLQAGQNITLERIDLHGNNSIDAETKSELELLLRLNRTGYRRLLGTFNDNHLPLSLWPLVLSKLGKRNINADLVFKLLLEMPALFFQ